MIRRLLGSLLKSDLDPAIDWSEIRDEEVIAREAVPSPMLFSRTETLEYVLCEAGDALAVYARGSRAGTIRRVRFFRPLDGRGMRITEWIPGENPVFRLCLSPVNGQTVVCDMCYPAWFGLWWNEPTTDDFGAHGCFIDSTDRNSLVKLRSQLLGGDVPEALRNEEAMWEKMNSLPESDRRAAFATLVTQQLGELDRKFDAEHPDLGPLPDELKPLNDHIQQQLDRIRQTAASHPVDPELAKRMQQFTRETHDSAP